MPRWNIGSSFASSASNESKRVKTSCDSCGDHAQNTRELHDYTVTSIPVSVLIHLKSEFFLLILAEKEFAPMEEVISAQLMKSFHSSYR